MKFLSLLFLTTTFAANSFSARLIAKNPNKDLLEKNKEIKIKNHFTFQQNTYFGIEVDQAIESADLAQKINAEVVFIDTPIELIEPTKVVQGKPAWHVTDLHYDQLTNLTAQGQNIVVAIMDTGVDNKHIALQNNMWINSDEIAGNKIDDDKNGYIDDTFGFNFVDRNSNAGPNNSDHGTHCAGIVASAPETNGIARGVAPQTKIMSVKIIEPKNRVTFLSDTAEAIKYAVDNGANILSNSWRIYKDWDYYSAPGKTLLKEAITYAEAHQVIFVAAAGNEASDNDTMMEGAAEEIVPAGLVGHPNLVVVASADEGATRSSFSNYGQNSVHISAPGDSIRSTVPGNKWEEMSGTSMATPLIAGALARGLSSGMTMIEAIEHLKATTTKSTEWDAYVQSGYVNLVEYLK